MTIALLVITLRVFVPFTIFRWPLFGGLLAFIADIYDFTLLNNFGWGFLTSETYQPVDKLLDMYYLSFEAFIALKWNDLLAKRTALALFSWRLIGVIAFELTQIRKFLFFAPNIFEYFYLTFLTIRKFNRVFYLDKKWLVILLFIIGVPKLIIEFALHYVEYPLSISTAWNFIKEIIFR